MDITIEKYYSFYFHPFNGYSDAEKEAIRENLLLEFQVNEEEFENEREKKNARYFPKNREITATSRKGEGGEKPTQKKRYKTFSSKKALHAKSLIILKLDYFL